MGFITQSLLCLAFGFAAAAKSSSGYTFTAPLDGDVVTVGQSSVISWNSSSSSTSLISFYLEKSGDEDTVLYTIASDIENSGAITWRVPSNVSTGDDYVIALVPEEDETDIYYTDVFSVSNSSSSTTYYPTEGEEYDAGSTMVITWKVDSDVSDVSVYLMQGKSTDSLQNISTVATSIENTGSIGYVIPSGTANGDDYYFAIVSSDDPDTVIYSDGFSIISDVTSAETSAAAVSAASASSASVAAAKTASTTRSSASAASSSALSTSATGSSSASATSSAASTSSTAAAAMNSASLFVPIMGPLLMLLNYV
ncbi:hypothetical protein BZA70DRAFT_286158 [Myxozyma melibiosi]|uniref:Yeast cell wall synthesis Kre9/Knh1-like N-terminal domain-containing protein n=1 Tax=Myxozyma melibiosi TaxID=54550 RepID=A0ABR1EXU4_9ASCO